jgi:hypothetical protein
MHNRRSPSYASVGKIAGPCFVPSAERGVPHISLVFREMWDTTNLNPFFGLRKKHVERCGIPHLAKNQRDMGHPTPCGRERDGTR